jgi:hypothetical protein
MTLNMNGHDIDNVNLVDGYDVSAQFGDIATSTDVLDLSKLNASSATATYLYRSGDTMTGVLYVGTMTTVGQINFADGTVMTSSPTFAGDNLGNHTATQNLDMATFNMVNVSSNNYNLMDQFGLIDSSITAAQATADAALPKSGGTMTGGINMGGNDLTMNNGTIYGSVAVKFGSSIETYNNSISLTGTGGQGGSINLSGDGNGIGDIIFNPDVSGTGGSISGVKSLSMDGTGGNLDVNGGQIVDNGASGYISFGNDINVGDASITDQTGDGNVTMGSPLDMNGKQIVDNSNSYVSFGNDIDVGDTNITDQTGDGNVTMGSNLDLNGQQITDNNDSNVDFGHNIRMNNNTNIDLNGTGQIVDGNDGVIDIGNQLAMNNNEMVNVSSITFADGTMMVSTAGFGGSGGDNLGDHIATMTLNMGGNDIENVNLVDGYDISAQFGSIAASTNAISVSTEAIRNDLNQVKLDTGTLRTDVNSKATADDIASATTTLKNS